MRMDFSIIKWETNNPHYELSIDGKSQLNDIPIGELRHIFYEMEKFARLRFKGEMKHGKK